jgi:tripartite-type tricarboxylate transporter receptor subunit TctC
MNIARKIEYLSAHTIALFSCAVAALSFVVATSARAEDAYPNRAVKIVVPYTPGGANDSLARIVGQKLGETLKQPVIVENRPGAGGVLGTASVAKAPADGYTLLIINTLPHVASGALYKAPQYDPINDFDAVALLAVTPYVVVVNQASKYKSLNDLIEDAKRSPGKIAYASGGQGGATHLTTELLRTQAQIDLLHVPYKGGGPAITDVLGGQVAFTVENIIAVQSFLSSGKLRPLAVTSLQPSKTLPGVPTVASIIKSDFDVQGRFAIVAPRGTPAPIIDKLNKEITQIIESPEVSKILVSQGVQPQTSSPQELVSSMKNESALWTKVIKDKGISLD